jgi:hypothetical protein
MYPEDAIQSMIDAWWVEDPSTSLCRGRLIKAFLPHVDQIPKQFIATGRSSATDHTRADYEIAPLRIKQPRQRPRLPVAALPAFEGEVNAIYRAKTRPALLVSEGGPQVEKTLTLGKPKWQTAPTVLVAPYYGVDEGGKRSGFRPEFVNRVRRCEYPQFMWDALPFGGSTTESILRLDHLQPIGRHHDTIEVTPYRLSEDALEVFDDWLDWLIGREFVEESLLLFFREEIRNIEEG